jgi:adenine-specific DNA-methyltransferase
LVENNLIDKIVDLKHYQAFEATTYSAIAILKKGRQVRTTDYYLFDDKNNTPYYVDTLSVDDYYTANNFYFAEKCQLGDLKRTLSLQLAKEKFVVKNGFATLADDFFIGDFAFDEFTIPVVKASTGKRYKCLFPYRNDKLLPYEELSKSAVIKNYFEINKEMLTKRSLESKGEWYGFGRSQGISDVYKCKYAINALIKNVSDLKLVKCDEGVGVYSGLYILTDISEMELRDILYTQDFINYVAMLGKYKSGGYYTFSSKDLKNYLEYKYSQRNGYQYEQLPIFVNT